MLSRVYVGVDVCSLSCSLSLSLSLSRESIKSSRYGGGNDVVVITENLPNNKIGRQSCIGMAGKRKTTIRYAIATLVMKRKAHKQNALCCSSSSSSH